MDSCLMPFSHVYIYIFARWCPIVSQVGLELQFYEWVYDTYTELVAMGLQSRYS